MHEMAIVQSIIDILEQQARIHEARKVISVKLEFGALTAVLPSAVNFAFEILSKGGFTEGAQLDITIIPIKVFCPDCEKETGPRRISTILSSLLFTGTQNCRGPRRNAHCINGN